jgi:hypothetical protein
MVSAAPLDGRRLTARPLKLTFEGPSRGLARLCAVERDRVLGAAAAVKAGAKDQNEDHREPLRLPRRVP